MAFLILWEYRVQPGQIRQFREMYGQQGAWAKLFSAAPGFLRTELHRDVDLPNRFLTMDYWASAEAYETFLNDKASEYAQLDAKCERLTKSERKIGSLLCDDASDNH